MKKDECNKIHVFRQKDSKYEEIGRGVGKDETYISAYSSGNYRVKVPDMDYLYNGISSYLADNLY